MDWRRSHGSGRQLVTGQDQTSELSKGLSSRRAIDWGLKERWAGRAGRAPPTPVRYSFTLHRLGVEKGRNGGSVPESLKRLFWHAEHRIRRAAVRVSSSPPRQCFPRRLGPVRGPCATPREKEFHSGLLIEHPGTVRCTGCKVLLVEVHCAALDYFLRLRWDFVSSWQTGSRAGWSEWVGKNEEGAHD